MKEMDANIQIRMPKEMKDEFQRIANENAQNPSQLVRNWIKDYIEENKKEELNKMKVIETLDLRKLWEVFDFHYLRPEELNEKEAAFVELKNHAYEDNWALPRTIAGWVYVEAWFDNMVEGQPRRRGATRLQWRPDMGRPIHLDSYANSNNGASIYFIPKVYVGGEYRYDIKIDIQYTLMGAAEYGKLYATEKKK